MFRSILAITISFTCIAPTTAGMIDFEDLTLAPHSYQDGFTLSPNGTFMSGGATFNTGPYVGWAYSNIVDTTTASYLNQYASFSGGGDASANYGVGFNYTPGDTTIDLPTNTAPVSIRITNTTYTALSMKNGDAFAKKFGGNSGNDSDYLLLTITGTNSLNQSTGSVDFYLADYRFADNSQDYIVSNWTTVDLTSLTSDTTKLSFGLVTTDVGIYGSNTPMYFAADNLTTASVPEPSSLVLLACSGLGVWWRSRRGLQNPVM